MNAATIAERQARERLSHAVALPASARMSNLPREAHAPLAARQHYFRRLTGLLEDAAWLVVIVLMFPLTILLIGAPIALFLRLLVEIVHLFS
jgi:hypothetical protein